MQMVDKIAFNIKNKKITINNFVDLCCAPGYHINYIKQYYPDAKYLGFTLGREDMGYILLNNLNKKNIIFKDISVDILKTVRLIRKKFTTIEYFNIDCIANHINNPSLDVRYHIKVLSASLFITLSCLSENGNLLMLYTLKNEYLYGNIFWLLSCFFEEDIPIKLLNAYVQHSVLYFKCSNRKKYTNLIKKKLEFIYLLYKTQNIKLSNTKLYTKTFESNIENILNIFGIFKINIY